MYPPEPTKDPYQLLTNLWSSLRRACEDHWGSECTIDPAEGGGYKLTLRFAEAMTERGWELASRYVRSYSKASHWAVDKLTRRQTHMELIVEHSPPKPKKKWRREPDPAPQKTS